MNINTVITGLSYKRIAQKILFAFLVFNSQMTLAALTVGDKLSSIEFHDQHDRLHTINEDVRLILFSSDRPASKLVQQALEKKNAAFLEQRGLLSIADISNMPTIITRLFALPKMRRSAYPMLLGRTPEKTELFPRESGKLTLVYLNQLEVIDIIMTDSLKVIQSALEERNELEH